MICVLGCGAAPMPQAVPIEAFPVIDPEDPQSIARWEASRYNFADAKIQVVKSRFFHGSLGNSKPKEPKSIALQVYQAKTKGITAEQQAAMDDFIKNEEAIHAAVRSAIYEYYKKSYPAYKEGLSLGAALYGGADEIDEILPEITSGQELDDLVQFGTIYVHPLQNGSAPIGMDLVVPWDEEHGMGLRLKDGKVEAVGLGHEAFPVPAR
jgi:hypothetical protein